MGNSTFTRTFTLPSCGAYRLDRAIQGQRESKLDLFHRHQPPADCDHAIVRHPEKGARDDVVRIERADRRSARHQS